MIPDFPHNIRKRLAQLKFFLLPVDVAKSLPYWLSQFSFSKLRQPTGQRLSNVGTPVKNPKHLFTQAKSLKISENKVNFFSVYRRKRNLVLLPIQTLHEHPRNGFWKGFWCTFFLVILNLWSCAICPSVSIILVLRIGKITVFWPSY
jgi:hypothetical protein